MKVLLMMLVTLGSMLLSSLASAESLDQDFYCADRAPGHRKGYILHFSPDGAFDIRVEGRAALRRGKYSFTGDRLSLSLPSSTPSMAPWAESSEAVEVRWGNPITFRTPRLSCHTVGHRSGPEITGLVIQCPTVGGSTPGVWVPGGTMYSGLIEDNTFRFYENHHVRRFRTSYGSVSAPGSSYSNEQSETTTGIYFIQGDKIYMAFGRQEEKGERFLAGTINADKSITFGVLGRRWDEHSALERATCK
ncbi:hypothetical protein WME90_34940 [Sorangium sp. So ce375]|uniref:hypothetical protein n=1 Tax=Sorangium sp. So ce375 TaxID=3133306 RepID=UPI003F5B660E